MLTLLPLSISTLGFHILEFPGCILPLQINLQLRGGFRNRGFQIRYGLPVQTEMHPASMPTSAVDEEWLRVLCYTARQKQDEIGRMLCVVAMVNRFWESADHFFKTLVKMNSSKTRERAQPSVGAFDPADSATSATVTNAASVGLSTRRGLEPFVAGRDVPADPPRAAVAPLSRSTRLQATQNDVPPLQGARSVSQAHHQCRHCLLTPSDALPEVRAAATVAAPALCNVHFGLPAATTRHRCLRCSGRLSSQNCQDTSSPWHRGQWLLGRDACGPTATVDFRAKTLCPSHETIGDRDLDPVNTHQALPHTDGVTSEPLHCSGRLQA